MRIQQRDSVKPGRPQSLRKRRGGSGWLEGRLRLVYAFGWWKGLKRVVSR